MYVLDPYLVLKPNIPPSTGRLYLIYNDCPMFSLIFLLVDNAYACDPRIKKFKDEEKEKKLAEKKAKEEAARAVAEEKERVSKLNNSLLCKY